MAVIGGGVSGLVAARVLDHDGFDVSILEKEDTPGGVWAACRSYPGLRTNNPAPTYALSDFPHAGTSDEFPTAGQLRAYFDSYIDHFGLRDRLRLGTEVVSVARNPSRADGAHGGFRVRTRPAGEGSGTETDEDFDRVVVCNGVLSEPYVPRFKGLEQFAGPVVHSSRLPQVGSLAGKRVVVVGGGKSALDCATHAGARAAACTLVFRRPYWMLPRYFFGRTRVDRQVFTRITELLTFPAYHHLPTTEKILRRAGTPLLPLLWLYRKLQCRIVARQSGIPDFMVPDAPIHARIFHQGIGPEFYAAYHRGEVDARRAGIDSFAGADRVRLDSGEELQADLVICATGWRRNIDFLESGLAREVRPEGHFRLYRHILPPGEQRLGFVGYASSGNTPLTSEIAAHWLSQCFRGELALPDRSALEASIDRVLEWNRRVFPEQPEGHFIGAYIAHYIDWLMADMGLATRRCKRLATEWTGPFHADRYKTVAEERRELREAQDHRQA